ncbi:MAG: hypothetical protein JNK77_08900 [Saprospiraceae bacterium]|nr:hypothetical protein [Saprospiraceae bacterium]
MKQGHPIIIAMKRFSKALFLLGLSCFLFTGLLHAQTTLAIKVTGTGRTTGHVADLTLTNTGDKQLDGVLKSQFIPSGGQYQPYVISKPITYNIPPGGSITVPAEGYCTDVRLPAPPPGTSLPTPAVPADPAMLETLQRIVETTTELQESGLLTTPFTGNPQAEIITVIQQTYWIHIASGTPTPYGFSEFCDQIRQQPGAPAAATLTPGINQLWETILIVGETAGIPAFLPSPLPPAAQTLTPPQGDLPPGIEITAKGTGRTTGHIADLIINNGTDQPFDIQLGPGSKPNAFFIPSGGQYQPYIVPSLPPVTVPPRQTLTFPVEGYCVDIHRPPVPSGNGMPKPGEWLSIPVPGPDIMAPGNLVNIPTAAALPLNDAIRILQNTQAPIHQTGTPAAGSDCIRYPTTASPTVPGTDIPITQPLIPDQQPGIVAPLLLDALNIITRTYDKLRDNNNIQTPFSGNPEKEREAVIQQTFWMFTASLSGDKYVKDDFRNNTIKQFEQTTSKPFSETPKPQQDKIDQGVDDFWDSFSAVGVEAKVLKTPPATPAIPSQPVQDFWNNYTTGEAKIPATNSNDPTGTPDLQIPVEGVDTAPELIKNEQKNKCACGNITFDCAVTTPAAAGKKPEVTTLNYNNARLNTKHRVGPKLKAGDTATIDINNLITTCSGCNNQCIAENIKVNVLTGLLDSPNGMGASVAAHATVTEKGKNAYSLSVTMPEGELNLGVYIYVSYTCKDNGKGKNPCAQASCIDSFLLTLPRLQACACSDVPLSLEVSHKPAGSKAKVEPKTLTMGEESPSQTWDTNVGKDDLITIKVTSLTPKCTGCKTTCLPGTVSLVVSGSNITGLKEKEKAALVQYRANQTLVSSKKVTGDNGEVYCTITVKYTCASKAADCQPKECEKDYKVVFNRK